MSTQYLIRIEPAEFGRTPLQRKLDAIFDSHAWFWSTTAVSHNGEKIDAELVEQGWARTEARARAAAQRSADENEAEAVLGYAYEPGRQPTRVKQVRIMGQNQKFIEDPKV